MIDFLLGNEMSFSQRMSGRPRLECPSASGRRQRADRRNGAPDGLEQTARDHQGACRQQPTTRGRTLSYAARGQFQTSRTACSVANRFFATTLSICGNSPPTGDPMISEAALR
jgi:hypothetical protein